MLCSCALLRAVIFFMVLLLSLLWTSDNYDPLTAIYLAIGTRLINTLAKHDFTNTLNHPEQVSLPIPALAAITFVTVIGAIHFRFVVEYFYILGYTTSPNGEHQHNDNGSHNDSSKSSYTIELASNRYRTRGGLNHNESTCHVTGRAIEEGRAYFQPTHASQVNLFSKRHIYADTPRAAPKIGRAHV